MYFYIFNDREMADTIMKATKESYMIFERGDKGVVYSIKKTKEVMVAYISIKETRRLNGNSLR